MEVAKSVAESTISITRLQRLCAARSFEDIFPECRHQHSVYERTTIRRSGVYEVTSAEEDDLSARS